MKNNELLEGFEGMYSDGEDVRCYSVSVIKTRRPHKCPGFALEELHDLPVGSVAIKETAIVDGKWASAYTCAGCVEQWKAFRESAA